MQLFIIQEKCGKKIKSPPKNLCKINLLLNVQEWKYRNLLVKTAI